MILKVIGKWPSSLHDKIEELTSDFLMSSPFERDLQQNVVVSFFSVFLAVRKTVSVKVNLLIKAINLICNVRGFDK